MKTLKQLCEDYENSDSIKERNELREEIENRCSAYLSKLYNTATEYKYTEPLFQYTDYRSNSGQITFDDFSDKNITVIYEDSWRYGGHCRDTLCFSFEKMESFNVEDYKKSIRKYHKTQLESDVKVYRQCLEKALEELENYELV